MKKKEFFLFKTNMTTSKKSLNIGKMTPINQKLKYEFTFSF